MVVVIIAFLFIVGAFLFGYQAGKHDMFVFKTVEAKTSSKKRK